MADFKHIIPDFSGNQNEVLPAIDFLNHATWATRFNEPVGIAFAGNEKVYVALSSENQINNDITSELGTAIIGKQDR